MKKIISCFLAVILAFACCIPAMAYSHEVTEMDEYGFVDVGDCEIEYGVYGENNEQAIILMPGNGNDMHSFDSTLVPELSKTYKVITFSPRNNGNSGRGEGKLTFELMADDVKKVLDYLGVSSTYVFGFSDGGNLALVFTLRYPEYVTKVISMSANINMWGTKFTSEISIIYRYLLNSLIVMANPSNEEARKKRDNLGMMVNQPTLTFDDLENISVPALNIYGEHDMMYRWHSKKITESIPGCREVMVIGGEHSSCFDYTDEVLLPAILPFLAE